MQPGSATSAVAQASAGERGPQMPRVGVQGKFLFAGNDKFFVRGVTYGPFRPEPSGSEYHTAELVERDFAEMQRNGINAVRLYTAPPPWLLDLALKHELRLLIGLPWEQHVTFLDDPARARDIERRVRAAVRDCVGHPAVLAYAIGNEIPSPLVRWFGHRRIEQYLERLHWAAKQEDPDALVTYVNYPSTEYLELPFLDFIAFNVYLETPDRLRAYLARLQNIAGERPLLLAEVGLDSARHGESRQAQVLQWQTQAIFEGGCAGLFIFSWTDEWHRGGQDILDWQFGLTTTDRRPKPALCTVRDTFQAVPFPAGNWPMFSVVICSYNGSRTLRSTLEAVRKLKYPAFETIVVDDGSTDATPVIAREYNVRLIQIPNGGLSNARNVGWREAKGEFVAYLDDDAAPDSHWLTYLASAFQSAEYAGVGGANLAWPDDGLVAECVDQSPGNPTHVLTTDREAEHLPGCNMAFRKSCLAAVGGFDPQFRIAGDDVDLCWRLQQQGWKLGFHPGAMVWHHRRGTVSSYWRQQVNYGKAEAMLERKWPEKYNAVGHMTWNGRLYGNGLFSWVNWSRRRIYHGTWGTALFQSVYSVAPGVLSSLIMLPEWYLVIALLAIIAACGLLFAPLRFALPLLVIAFIPPLTHAALSGGRAVFKSTRRFGLRWFPRAALTAFLHFLQPAARLCGRVNYGLTPWRRRGPGQLVFPRSRAINLWSENDWQSPEARLRGFEDVLRGAGAAVRRGGEFDRWDLEVRGGLLGTARLSMVIEEHGAGRQNVRLRIRPVARPMPIIAALVFVALAILSALNQQWTSWALLNIPAIFLLGRTLYECGLATAALQQAIPAELPMKSSPPAPAEPPANRTGLPPRAESPAPALSTK